MEYTSLTHMHRISFDQKGKAVSTEVSRAVPHLSTNSALTRLTSEFGWDPVHMG